MPTWISIFLAYLCMGGLPFASAAKKRSLPSVLFFGWFVLMLISVHSLIAIEAFWTLIGSSLVLGLGALIALIRYEVFQKSKSGRTTNFRFEETVPPKLSRLKLSVVLKDLAQRTRERIWNAIVGRHSS